METNQARTDANHEEMIAKLDSHHERMMACLGKTEATDLEANPEEMQSEAVLREVPKEEAAVKSSAAAERRQKPKEWTRGNCGSRKKLVTAVRKMNSRA
jgi:hypothetical protein